MSVPTMMPAPPAAARTAPTQRTDSGGRAESAQKFDSQVKEQVSSSQQDEQERQPAQKPAESSVSKPPVETVPVEDTATKKPESSDAAAEAAMHAFGFMLAQETAVEPGDVPVETTPIFDELAALVQESTGEPVLATVPVVVPVAQHPAAEETPTEAPAQVETSTPVPVVEGAADEPATVSMLPAASVAAPAAPVVQTPHVAAPESASVQPVALATQQNHAQDGGSQQAPQQQVAPTVAVAASNATEQPATAFALPVQPSAVTETAAAARPIHLTPATTPAGMLEQMRGPIGRLTAAIPGEHTFTVNVTPENLGPVTVRAHITGEGVRVELIGATDSARDSLRAILTDLKRDLQSTGLSAQLNLSEDTGNGAQEFGAREFGSQGNAQRGQSASTAQVAADHLDLTPEPQQAGDALGVDILA